MKKREINKVAAVVASVVFAGASLVGCGDAATQTAAAEPTTEAATETTEVAETEVAKADAPQDVTKIYVAYTPAGAPFDFTNDAGEADGYEVAALKAVDELLPQYEFVYEPAEYEAINTGVKTGKYDIGLHDATYTPERAESFDLSGNPSGYSLVGLLIRSDIKDITTLDQLASSDINFTPQHPGNGNASAFKNWLSKHPEYDFTWEQADDSSIIVQSAQYIAEGRYDANFWPAPWYQSYVVAEDGAYHAYQDKLDFYPVFSIPAYPLISIDNTELSTAVSDALGQLKADGTLKELSIQYLGEDQFDYVDIDFRNLK